MKLLTELYSKYVRCLDAFAPVFLLVVRVYIGYRFARTGWGKLHNLDDIAGFFASLNIPAPYVNAVAASTIEFVGGVGLALGLGARLVSLPLAITMIVAYLTAHREVVLGFGENPSAFFAEEPFPYLFTSLMVLFFGAGKWSLDALICRQRKMPS